MALLKKAAWTVALLWALGGSFTLSAIFLTLWEHSDHEGLSVLMHPSNFIAWGWVLVTLACVTFAVRWRAFAPWK